MLIVGTGGLSHQLDGKRAGFINKDFDQLCLDKIVNDPEALTRYSIHDLVELAGAQGVEFLNWMAMRGALTGRVTEVHRNYHIPISNTAAATIVLENATVGAPGGVRRSLRSGLPRELMRGVQFNSRTDRGHRS